MKIRPMDSTGCPVPGFSIEPENETERLLIKAFCLFPASAHGDWKFTFNGAVYSNGIQSFSFGWKLFETAAQGINRTLNEEHQGDGQTSWGLTHQMNVERMGAEAHDKGVPREAPEGITPTEAVWWTGGWDAAADMHS